MREQLKLIVPDDAKLLLAALRGKPVPEADRQRLMELLHRPDAKHSRKYLRAAKQYQTDGELEFDENAVISVSDDNGAYVLGWRWVDDDEAGVKREVRHAR